MEAILAAAGGLFLLSILLLFAPIRIRARLCAGPSGCTGSVRAAVLCTPVTLRFRARLLQPPYGRVDLLTRRGKVKRTLHLFAPREKPSRLSSALLRAVRVRQIRLLLRCGAGARPDLAALSCGGFAATAYAAADALGLRGRVSVSASVDMGGAPVRINLEGIVTLTCADIIREILQ